MEKSVQATGMCKIPFEKIAEVTEGAYKVIPDNDGLRFERFDDATLAYYANLMQSRYERALCTAGVVLRFQTDSERLAFSFELDIKVRSYSFIDVYVDNVFIGSAGADNAPERIAGEFKLPASSGSLQTITLYLPHCRRARLLALELAGSAEFLPAAPRPKLLAMGDSITQGMDCFHPSLTYAAVMARVLGCSLYNQGVGGHVFDAAGLCAPPVTGPEVITVAYGVNDWSKGLDIASAETWLQRLRELYPAAPIVVFEPIWASRVGADIEPQPNQSGRTLADCRRELAAIAVGMKNVTNVSMTRLLPPGPRFLADSVHPTDSGHLVYGLNAAAIIREITGK